MAKKKKSQTQQASTPQNYVRTRMRGLPIGKCYLNPNWKDEGMVMIVVTRQHPKGTVSYAMYLVDTWCRGLVDTFYRFNLSQDEYKAELDGLMDRAPFEIEEGDYDLIHNIIYGAIEYAGEVEIMPYPDWDLTKYFLMEDNDDAPYMEIEFGKNGKYTLCVHDKLEASRYLSKLDRILGQGNYHYILPYSDEDEDDEDDDMDQHFNDIDLSGGFNTGVKGVYCYKHPEYPTEEALTGLHFPELVETLQIPIEDIPDSKIDSILALPHDQLADDLELIIRVALGADYQVIDDRNWDEVKYDYPVVTTAMILLGAIGDPSRLDTVLEVLRQSFNNYDFYFGDWGSTTVSPVIYQLAKNSPDQIYDFMIEPGLDPFSRHAVIDGWVNGIMKYEPGRRDEAVNLLRRILEYYLDHNDDPQIWDGTLVGLLIGNMELTKAVELEGLLRDLYATEKVDEHCFGEIEKAVGYLSHGKREPDIAPIEIHKWLKEYRQAIDRLKKR